MSGIVRRRRARLAAIRKDAVAELDRLERLLSAMEGRVRSAFAEFVRNMRSEEIIREVADMIERGDIESALSIADSHVDRLASVIPAIFQDAGVAEAAALAATIRPLNPTVGISFDATDPAAAALMRENTLGFIRDFTDAQRIATRDALVDALASGQGRQEAARAFRNSIGLTPSQANAVKSYRVLLEQGSRQALDRALRDRRYDRSVAAAADGRRPLTPQQIETMTERYRQRALASRAETIARTESVRTISQAREEAFRQNLKAAGISQDDAEQTWNAVGDLRTRVTHRAMNGQVRPFGVPFDSPGGAKLRYPGDPAAPADEVINCRCHRTFRIKPASVEKLRKGGFLCEPCLLLAA